MGGGMMQKASKNVKKMGGMGGMGFGGMGYGDL